MCSKLSFCVSFPPINCPSQSGKEIIMTTRVTIQGYTNLGKCGDFNTDQVIDADGDGIAME